MSKQLVEISHPDVESTGHVPASALPRVKEQGWKVVGDEPVVFCKFPTTIRGPGEPIELPPASTEVDYEAELVVVIGREGRHIPREAAMQHVAHRDPEDQQRDRRDLLGRDEQETERRLETHADEQPERDEQDPEAEEHLRQQLQAIAPRGDATERPRARHQHQRADQERERHQLDADSLEKEHLGDVLHRDVDPAEQEESAGAPSECSRLAGLDTELSKHGEAGTIAFRVNLSQAAGLASSAAHAAVAGRRPFDERVIACA